MVRSLPNSRNNIMANLVVISALNNEELIKAEAQLKTTNKPFTRNKLILDKIRSWFPDAKYIINSTAPNTIEEKLRELNVIDGKYLDFLKNAWNTFTAAKNIESEFKSPFDQGLVNYVFCKNQLDVSLLPYYLQCGFYGNDYCTSIFSHTYQTAIQSAYNTILAADSIAPKQIVYCANIFPGHHATKNSYSGYCFINNAAVCAEILRKNGKRVAILDIDFHHGDGTQKIFANDKNVLTISLHGDPSTNYPFYTGYRDENTESNYNYPFEKKYHNPEIYRFVLDTAMTRIKSFAADYLIIAFGMDTYYNDPEGGMGFKIQDYRKIARNIRDNYPGSIIVTQEGGYCMDAVADIAVTFLGGLCS